MSRSFTFRASSEGDAGSRPPEPGLAPFVDMVNHHENPHVIVQVTRDAFPLPFHAFAVAFGSILFFHNSIGNDLNILPSQSDIIKGVEMGIGR